MAPQPQRPDGKTFLAAVTTVAAVYVYFLIFAQFGFLRAVEAAWGSLDFVVHAIAWALGYVPLGVAAAPAVAPMIALLATLFAATTIGVLLGALRLRGGRVVPAALANAAMTITAGLPMVLA